LELRAARGYLRSLGVANPTGIFTFTAPSELIALMRLAMCCEAGSRALEIGSHLGASALFIGGAIAKRGGHLYCVDTWNNETMPDGERDTFAEFLTNTSPLRRAIIPLRGRSTQIDRTQIKSPLQLLFIDGDHSYDAVRDDFRYYEPLLAPNAIVAFHDCTAYCGVARFIGELLAGTDWTVAGSERSLLWIERAEWKANRRVRG
jgi:predicted O-methyltransferase YrrM